MHGVPNVKNDVHQRQKWGSGRQKWSSEPHAWTSERQKWGSGRQKLRLPTSNLGIRTSKMTCTNVKNDVTYRQISNYKINKQKTNS